MVHPIYLKCKCVFLCFLHQKSSRVNRSIVGSDLLTWLVLKFESSVVVLDSYMLLENSNFWNWMIFGLYCGLKVYDFSGNPKTFSTSWIMINMNNMQFNEKKAIIV